jgi:hypothetical protein
MWREERAEEQGSRKAREEEVREAKWDRGPLGKS